MRIGLYSREWQMAMDEARRGLVGLGHSCEWRRHSVYRPNDQEAFDLVVTVGFKGPGALVASDYRAKGVPVIVMEPPAFGLALGTRPIPDPKASYWRLSLGDHSWLFPEGAPGDRAAQLGIGPEFSPGRRGASVIVLGQMPGDSTHELGSDAEVLAWAEGVSSRIREQVDAPVVWRPHPGFINKPRPRGYDGVSLGPLEDALRSAYACVTISSGAGLAALMAGVPVVALGPSVYRHLGAEYRDLPKLKPPAKEGVEDLCNRLAYQHWGRSELVAGRGLSLFVALAQGLPLRWPAAPKPEPPPPILVAEESPVSEVQAGEAPTDGEPAEQVKIIAPARKRSRKRRAS